MVISYFFFFFKRNFSAGKPSASKAMAAIPPENNVKSALATSGLSDVSNQVAKPAETPQVPGAGDISLTHLTGEDLQTEGLEPRFTSTLPRVSMAISGSIPVSGLYTA